MPQKKLHEIKRSLITLQITQPPFFRIRFVFHVFVTNRIQY